MAEQRQQDWITPVAVIGGAALLGVGAYMVFKPKATPGVPTRLVIKGYKNMKNGVTVPAGTTLAVEHGDVVRVAFAYDYQGPATNITYTVAIFSGVLRYGEAVGGEELPDTPAKKTVPYEMDVVVDDLFIGTYQDRNLYVRAETPDGKADANLYKVIRIYPAVDPDGPDVTDFSIVSFPAIIPNGETMNVQVGMNYQGPATTVLLRAALGRMRALIFDEYLYTQITVTLPASTQPTPRQFTIPILVNLAPENSPYTLEAKLATLIPKLDRKVDAVTVTGPPSTPQVQNLIIEDFTNPLTVGEPCHIMVYLEYKGPASAVRVHGSIGHFLLGLFTQERGADLDVAMAASEDWAPALVDVAVPTAGIGAGLYSVQVTAGGQLVRQPDVLQVNAVPVLGVFYVQLVGETGFYYTKWAVLWDTGDGEYVSQVGYFGTGEYVKVSDAGLPVLLTGRIKIYMLDERTGNSRYFGPSAIYTVENNETYQFNCNTLQMWRV